jgi:hypothetical protein
MWQCVIALISTIYIIVAGILAGTLEDRKYVWFKSLCWPLMPFVNMYQLWSNHKKHKYERKLLIEQITKTRPIDDLVTFYNKIGSSS